MAHIKPVIHRDRILILHESYESTSLKQSLNENKGNLATALGNSVEDQARQEEHLAGADLNLEGLRLKLLRPRVLSYALGIGHVHRYPWHLIRR